jgi:sensor histidine kinase YesM
MNIHRRLLYYTGQGLTIVSAEGLGTKVSFRS